MSWENATILTAGIATLGIYSFLIKENPIFRFFEHLFIGIASGFLPILSIKNQLWPKVIAPLLGYNKSVFPDGYVVKSYEPVYLFYLIPLFFGLLYYSVFFKRISWLSRLVIGLSLGFSAGLSFKGFFAEIIPQISSSLKPLIVFDENSKFDYLASLSNQFFLVTLVLVIFYFLFSFRKENKISKGCDYSARWLMMICFGAFFGSTVMARMALLVERMTFLFNDCLNTLLKVFTF
jgi:hypothetical protein